MRIGEFPYFYGYLPGNTRKKRDSIALFLYTLRTQKLPCSTLEIPNELAFSSSSPSFFRRYIYLPKIEPDSKKDQYELSWPNVLRIDHIYRTKLSLDLNKVNPLEIKIRDTLTKAELAKILEGKPDTTDISQIDLASLGLRLRMQKIIFIAASEIFDQMRPSWKGSKEYLLAQLIKLVEDFIASNKLRITPSLLDQDEGMRQFT